MQRLCSDDLDLLIQITNLSHVAIEFKTTARGNSITHEPADNIAVKCYHHLLNYEFLGKKNWLVAR